MSKAITALAVSGLGSLLLSSNVYAQTQDANVSTKKTSVTTENRDITEFKKVTVNATRVSQDAEDVTRTVSVVEKEQLEEIQANSVAEAVSYQTNVSVGGGAVPGNQKINIRGLEGDKVLQVIDGARSNTNFSHRPSYFLDPELLKSVEVLKGPSSSLWGSGAIGGVVVQNTIESDDLIQEGNDVGGFIKKGYQTNGDVRTTSAGIAAKHDNMDVLFAATHYDSNFMKQGENVDSRQTLYGTEAKNTTYLGKFGIDLDQYQRVQAQYRYADLDGHPPTVGSTDEAENADDLLIDRLVKDQHAAIDYSHKGSSKYLNFDAKLYLNDTENEEVNLLEGTDQSDLKTIGLNLLNNFDFDQTQILVGIDGYKDTIETKRTEDASTGNRPNPPSKAESEVWGAFTTITHDLTSTIQLDASLRYDSFETESDDLDTSADENNLSTSAGIRWQATDWMRWSLRYDEAFRAPSSYELYIQGTHFNYGAPGWDNEFVANPDLKPETAKNIELSVDLAFNNLLADDKLTIAATAFQNDVEDFIYLDVVTTADFGPPPACNCVSGTSTHTNARDAELWGYELEANYQIGAFNALLSYGQTRGTHDTTTSSGTTKDHLPNIPADKWVADISYGFWDIDTKAGVRILSAEKQDRIEEDQHVYDGYTTTDLYATWEPSDTSLEGVKVDVVLANLQDTHYQQAFSEVYEPGRSLKVAAKYSF
ncbi:TonB-dependent hemoglobin/transferrin/lactoferrin family receptor [Litoribrevibacter euphylliae]|uniref:TonB-dependent hemoglobin/transferrin/lactoferrin family receptor n=1 Tax=Litoribrevibacter euphylliae TaxID=1834034 RepID=A0ABV7HJ58_9GAMM